MPSRAPRGRDRAATGYGQIGHLILPRDLKVTEVKRLTAFMSTLAVDFEPAGS